MPSPSPTPRLRTVVLILALFSLLAGAGAAEDWPEWRGAGRLGVYTEGDPLDAFPPGGLTYRWRVPIHGGYAGPAVAGGRVFVTDFRPAGDGPGAKGLERVLALDEKTGRVLWSREWNVDYGRLQPRYAIGPRATPTVDGDRVYVLGAMGALLCLDAAGGELRWRKDFVADYGTEVPVWGMAGAPLVEGSLLISLVGGKDGAEVVAFDKTSGREVWRALDAGDDPGYGQPVIFEIGGIRQLILWHPRAVSSLDPGSGKVYWQQPFEVAMGMTVATPVLSGRHLLVSSFFNGSMMLELATDKPAARLLWRGTSSDEVDTDGLHALITTPVVDGGMVYGVCSYGQLRALDAATGTRRWESMGPVVEKARWAAAFLVRWGDRTLINNDRGELILARLTPQGYQELDRTPLIEPTSSGGRRQLGAVHWSHPAYANRHVVVRNDKEIVRAYLGDSPQASPAQDRGGDSLPHTSPSRGDL
ncbi:MAG: PQQ-binding-like beta-propeller repeat protein [bacterium]|nr:PQQ-binding-like beta-propeller repeat protein [bacterium]